MCLAIMVLLLIGRISFLIISRLFLSPIAHFPGPRLAALTEWWEVFHTIKCEYHIIPAHGHGTILGAVVMSSWLTG